MASAQQAAGKRVSVPSSEPPVPALQRLFAAVVEPARTYPDSGYADSGYADSDYADSHDQRERSVSTQRRPWASQGAAPPVDTDGPARGWRRIDGGYTRDERQRRERAAWSNTTGAKSIIVFDGREYRRVVVGEGNRRGRY
jgi:hypothetical protein